MGLTAAQIESGVFDGVYFHSCLEEQIKAGELNRPGLEAANTHVRTKADKAMGLIGKIFYLEFLLSLSGLSEIYEQFGVIDQMTQMVHLLPHERMDLYNKSADNLRSM